MWFERSGAGPGNADHSARAGGRANTTSPVMKSIESRTTPALRRIALWPRPVVRTKRASGHARATASPAEMRTSLSPSSWITSAGVASAATEAGSSRSTQGTP